MYVIKDILNEEKFLKNIISKSLLIAQNKVDEAFIFIRKTYDMNSVIRNGSKEYIEFHEDCSFSITVYSNYHKGYASSTDLNIQSIKNTITAAIEISKYTSKDIYSTLPSINLKKYKVLDLDLFHLSNLNLKESLKMAYLTEKYTLDFDKRIVNSEGGCFSSGYTIIAFGNTKGLIQTYKFSQYSLSICVVAENNKFNTQERDYYYSISRKLDDLESPRSISKKCAKKVLLKLNSKKIITQRCSIILTSDVAASLFNHFAKSIFGYQVYNKSTFLLDSLGKLIFPKWLSIFENPHIKKGIASSPFDNEGTLTKPRFIVKNGVLQTWLLDSYSSKKLNLKNTGHLGGIYNWIFIQKNNISFQDLLYQMNTGLVITDLMGHGVNIVNGDYSRGASGYFIENGLFKYSVKEITISGNLKNIYKKIIAMSNDYDIRKNIQCGSIFISKMIISGK
ncbi:metalloprotease PmbA [Buchnera aphidicola]|uniref:metalloprotease PmbA n=1 Tax=Buchnera aphidicola TaxID=9 RepID=UPI0022388482|nr:metalloprotease PmbA [Buchnera aphidicola]MCW5197596.1 metalloprotease PmbA [Buchnera aphidicola (Chaitophorus viminalis)]